MTLVRAKSKDKARSSSTRKVTPPEPTYMNNDQFAAYLANLRDHRLKHPGGARPQPASASIRSRNLPSRPSLSGAGAPTPSATSPGHQRTQSEMREPRSSRPSLGSGRPSLSGTVASRYSTMSGRDYYHPEKSASVPLVKHDQVVPTATYIERGSRWMEKEDAVALRTAMEDLDLAEEATREQEQEPKKEATNEDDESRIYNAALNEAAELVWQHEHGVKPPEPGAPYRYKSHLRKNSYAYARTASIGLYGDDIMATGLARDHPRSTSGSSSGSEGRPSIDSPRLSMDSISMRSGKAYGSLNGSVRRGSGERRRSSIRRGISGEMEKPFSGDQIYEEPEPESPRLPMEKPRTRAKSPEAHVPLRLKLRQPPNRVSVIAESDEKSDKSRSSSPTKMVSRTEIYRNPPSQSRNPDYITNSPPKHPSGPRPNDEVPRKNGVEIRSDDIRQATSFRLSDRSKKLPTPSAVSDSPGRPIVSFDVDWKAPEEAATDVSPEPEPSPQQDTRRFTFGVQQGEHPSWSKEPQSRPGSQNTSNPSISSLPFTPNIQAEASSVSTSPTTSIPSIQIDEPDRPGSRRPSKPSVPAIAVTSDDRPVPSIVLPGEDDDGPNIPIVVTPDDNDSRPSSNSSAGGRPLPDPSKSRRLPRPRGHWSPDPRSANRTGATCHECGLPIEGRFVALAGSPERFHPKCFRCYQCGTSLEALEISPEPDSFRNERLDRIHRREAGEILPEEPGKTMAEDGDERLHFYCHLDWHELFAPRCKTCKTPIIGEHIVALGHHFHFGHFFCAECGDPFEYGMTHIEKDGYAWCVNCQTKRTERRAPKCRRCKKPVIGQYIQALGAEWHDECFRCAVCGGGFADGQIFPVGDRVLCTGCRQRELKA